MKVQGAALRAGLSGGLHQEADLAHLVFIVCPYGVVSRGLIAKPAFQVAVKNGGHIAIRQSCSLHTGEHHVPKALIAVSVSVPIQPQAGGGSNDLIGEEIVGAHGGNGSGRHPASGPNSHLNAASVLALHRGHNDLARSLQGGDLIAEILHHFGVLGEITGSQNDTLAGVKLNIAPIAGFGNHTGDTVIGFHQLLRPSFVEEPGTVCLGHLLVGLCDLGETGDPGKAGAAGPKPKAGDVPGELGMAGPVGHKNGIPLRLGQGFNEPVKAPAGFPGELQHQLGIGAVVAAKLPVVQELQLVHMGNAPLGQELGVNMSQVVAYGVKQPLLLLIQCDNGGSGLCGGSGCRGSGMGKAHHHHIGGEGFPDQSRVNGGRRGSPGRMGIWHEITSFSFRTFIISEL